MKKVLDYMLKYSFLLIYFGIFLLCMVGVNKFSYAYKLDISENNIIIFLCGLFFIILFLVSTKRLFRSSNNDRKILFFISITLLVWQIFLIRHYYFKTDWDVGVVVPVAEYLVSDVTIPVWANNYFSHYPNNLFITILFSKIMLLCKFIGLEESSYFIILIIQSILNILTGVLLFSVLRKVLSSISFAWIGYLLYILLIWMSPWVSIPYSEAWGLIFPILILYIYTNINSRNIYKNIVAIAMLSAIAYSIKPQTAIIVIAIIIVSVLYREKGHIKTMMKNSFVGIFIFLISIVGVNNFIHSSSLKIDLEQELSYLHFIKMGLNDKSDGGYLYRDVEESIEATTKKERQKKNLDTIKNRLKDYGIKGLSEHQAKKTLNNYNDGTFAWGLEGKFYYEIIETDSIFAKYIRSFYYNNGEYYSYFKYITQGTWLVVLFLILGNVFEKIKDMTKEKRVVYLSLVGIFLFESIFESRSRYLYTYVPIFIMAAMWGLDNSIKRFKKN